jgi:undecaprenyl-diphosphatase
MKRFILACCVILILFCTVFAENWDRKLYTSVRTDLKCKFLDKTMPAATRLGDKEFVMGLDLAVFCVGNDAIQDDAKIASVSLLLASGTTLLLKGIVNRERPEHQITTRWDSSFPSGHSTAAFATATAYGLVDKKLMPVYLSLATVVAFSRVYTGMHYPSDVLVGACIGVGSALIVNKYKDKVLKIKL